MSNQRPGKTHAAAAKQHTYQEMRVLDFFRMCAKQLGDTDAGFYFEQIKDHLEEGGTLPDNSKDVQRVLGL